MMMRSIQFLLVLICGTASAFVTPYSSMSVTTLSTTSSLAATSDNQSNDISNSEINSKNPLASIQSQMIATAAVVAANIPAAVWAVAEAVDEDYEYGKVDAPIGIALGGGLLAILTAGVPLLLRPGEEALEEMRENEGFSFGKDNKDALNKRRRR